MKQTWKIAITYGLPLGLINITTYSILNREINLVIVATGVITTLLGSVLFAFVIRYLMARLHKGITIELNPGEKIIKEGGANHFKGKEGVGGKLVLTDRRLIFKSHRFNIQNHEQTFHLRDIKELTETKTLNILKNGLALELVTDDLHKFIVDTPSEWVTEVERTKASLR